MNSRKGVSLPINVVVMTIIGITIFALGLGLFNKIYFSSENEVESLQNSIRNDIAALECDGDEWICMPSNKIKTGDSETFDVFIANRGDSNDRFKIDFEPGQLDLIDGTKEGITNSCGSIIVFYLKDQAIRIQSGHSGSMPLSVRATRVTKVPCSFTTTVSLYKESGEFVDKTPVIIRVE